MSVPAAVAAVAGCTSNQNGLGLATRLLRFAAWCGKAKLTHGAAIIVTDVGVGQVLLVRQRLRERGRWGLPGGFLNVSETPARAATREISEEVGLSVAESALLLVDEYKQPWAWHYEHLFWVAVDPAVVDTSARTVEISGVRWFDLARLPRLTRATEHALNRGAHSRARSAGPRRNQNRFRETSKLS